MIRRTGRFVQDGSDPDALDVLVRQSDRAWRRSALLDIAEDGLKQRAADGTNMVWRDLAAAAVDSLYAAGVLRREGQP